MGNILFCNFVLHLLHYFFQISAFPKTTTESFVIHYLEDRQIVPVRIELNANAQTEHVTSIAGETLYDFNQGKVAYKDLNSSQCFITNIVEESLENDRRRLKNMQNGVIRGFYLPTFIIQEEINNTTNLTENIGTLLAQFCTGNAISIVIKQTSRKKRDTSTEKGQFTHHSYGHYGHQSNNYAHYGHDTYVRGTVDENGQIRNQRVNHQQVTSQSSHVYPKPDNENGQQDSLRTNAGVTPVYRNRLQNTLSDSRIGTNIQHTPYQTQYRIPSYQQTFDGGLRSPNNGPRQFSLQSSHEGGYQLNLPLGLQAGNIYRGGVRSVGYHGEEGRKPQLRSDHKLYPDSSISTGYPSFDQRRPLPAAVPSYLSTLPGFPETDIRKYPSHIQPDTSAPAIHFAGDRRVLPPTGVQIAHTQIPSTESALRQPGINYESQLRKQTDHRTIPSLQKTLTVEDGSNLPHTPIDIPSSIQDMKTQVTGRQQGVGLPSIHVPSGAIQSPVPKQISTIPGTEIFDMQHATGVSRQRQGIPGQISAALPSSDISDRQHVSSIAPSGQIHGTYPDFKTRHQYIPSGIIPEHQYLQTSDIRQPTGYIGNGDIHEKSVPPLRTPGILYPGYPGTTDSENQQITRTLFPGSQAIPSTPYTTQQVSRETFRNGVHYPEATQPQIHIKDKYPNSGTYPAISRLPIDTSSTSVTKMRQGETALLPSGTSLISSETTRDGVTTELQPGETVQDSRSTPSRRIFSETSIPRDRRITGQTGFEASKIYGQNSASSQTQIQTGFEGTAAEASAAGHYGGLGSQAQVQGGYAGNGSFSAQAQSGFTGGVIQSQVQGGKLGGLSGSSAQVERVGSAHSQVQVLQPSGSASSTAQGRFTGGTTQVQAQSSKTGGSAGAQAQSTGLSSSHVQVNIGGNDISKDENFQGTVAASVNGGQSSGQSQTQLQGGYESGRTYSATAQGGFDTALGLEAGISPIGSMTNIPRSDSGDKQLISASRSQEPFATFNGNQHQMSGVPVSRDSSDIRQHRVLMPPASGTDDSRTSHMTFQTGHPRQRYAGLDQEPSRLLPSSQSSYRGVYPGYPSNVRDRRLLPTSSGEFPGYIPGYLPQRSAYPAISSHELKNETDQYYTPGIPPIYPKSSGVPPSQTRSTMDSRYMPSFPSVPQPDLSEHTGVQSGYLRPSYAPDHSQILTPNSQMIPSHRHPGEMTVLTKPDGSFYTESIHRHPPMTDQTRFQPGQHQFLPPTPQAQSGQARPYFQSQYPDISLSRPQIQPLQTIPSQLQPQIRPEQQQISLPKVQFSTTTEKIPILTPSETNERRLNGAPGVSEPEKGNCCTALRELKRRCCGGTSKQDRISPCCRSSSDDIFDFSSDDDLGEEKEPCKVVKAICYIVYKPVGKARICKPTAINGC